jgi:zinc transport system ATP-binding protein
VKSARPDTIVEITNVWVWLGRNLALRDVSLSIERGKFIGVMGPNGGGKTTLLKVIAGLIKPDRGTVRIHGTPSGTIGYVPQEDSVDPESPLTVKDVVAMGLYGAMGMFPRLTGPQKERVEEAINMVGMKHLASRMIGELSGGQKQRVFIARAVVGEPKLLLLDEPTTGVDAAARDDFYRLIFDLMEHLSLTIILASHDLEVVPTQVDEIVCVNQKVFIHAAPEEIKDTQVFREAYGCEFEFMLHGRYPHRVVERHSDGETHDR